MMTTHMIMMIRTNTNTIKLKERKKERERLLKWMGKIKYRLKDYTKFKLNIWVHTFNVCNHLKKK